jgi:ferredoxin-nitrite reductase
MLEGYHLFVGGGCGPEQNVGREVLRDVLASDVGPVLERLFRAYVEGRQTGGSGPESFQQFTVRQSVDALRELLKEEAAAV